MQVTRFRIVSNVTYSLIAIIVSWIVFTLSVWLPNVKLIGAVLSSTAPIMLKLSFIISLYGSITTNFSPLSGTYTILIAILFGINTALLTYYIRTVGDGIKSIKISGASSIGGLISGIFGIGCAACGTFLLTSILSLFGATGILALLPLAGAEFGIIAVLLLFYSMYTLLNKIKSPLVCPVNTNVN